ncbi:MAG: resD [Firmicutes bacterium]|nr:resD [Bacillota bacterium]
MEKRRILVVDDEQGIRDIIKEYVVKEDYEIVEAADGVEALNSIKSQEFAMVILDIMLPKLDGWTVCREIRKMSDMPVIMLSARGEEYDKLFGFELGIDDYLVKPFSPRELLARMKAIFARSDAKKAVAPVLNRMKMDGLEIDFDSHNVYLHQSQISLTPKEYDLLNFLVKNPNKVFSREQLLNLVWGYDFVGDDRTVDTHIKMLRESLKEYRKWIITAWGIGYKFEPGIAEEKL